MFQMIQAVDENIMLFIQNNIRCDFLNIIMVILTYAGQAGIIWILFSFYFYFIKKDKKTGILILAGISIGYLLNDMTIKELIMRPRPCVMIPELSTLIRAPASASFPSGHAVSCFCATHIIVRCKGKKWRWCYLLAAIIAFTRAYLGVHYLSDILVGAIFGIFIATIVLLLTKKLSFMSNHTNSD